MKMQTVAEAAKVLSEGKPISLCYQDARDGYIPTEFWNGTVNDIPEQYRDLPVLNVFRLARFEGKTKIADVEIACFIVERREGVTAVFDRERAFLHWPCKVRDIIDVVFSHNELVALWENREDGHYEIIRCEAWRLPENCQNLTCTQIFGIITEKISDSDYLNLEVEIPDGFVPDEPIDPIKLHEGAVEEDPSYCGVPFDPQEGKEC